MDNKVNNQEGRGSWGSSFGFIMAAAGSAVGLGNLWKFPYLAGKNGGAVFVVAYLLIVVLVGFTMMLGEMIIGRKTQLDPYGAYKKLNKNWGFLGSIGILTAFLILSYYSVVGGWVIKYIVATVTGKIGSDKAAYFTGFIGGSVEPLIYHGIFMVLTVAIVIKGISDGIEKASKFMMPALLVMLIVVAIRSVTLNGASAGLSYYLKPDFSKFRPSVLVDALGQVFFSLSLGMGALITYGSYLKGDENLEKNALIIPSLDTAVALLAGFAVLPAVFAFGFEPSQGPGLMFITLPAVFEVMPFGTIFGIIFFVLVFFAALTSAISLLEVAVAYCIDSLKWTRIKAVSIASTLMFIIGIFASLSMGPMADFHIPLFNRGVFDSLDFFTSNILMPIGGFLMAIFIGYIWGVDEAIAEVKRSPGVKFKLERFWTILIKYVVPFAIFIVLLSSLGLLDKILGK
ncbi:sodium-dependent transporter [Tissierella praeacuta]|uniref:Transporter n=1 Tax=Tissierella praeacuta DSM 18095 TaxID=1123404 RepID=A0A1M4YTB0_9FIRM|nr:sodium-dependent transporter [Tissierella praeacuta]TCU71556.1 NSS family neurotransmitter:Na+ symporter [Tissierella praeacuta]SHF09079.1 neurotransmitter:Na+ symporter, NSS family [Tissierella praeacuta DSM 18095]SUP00793.1 Na+-dependent transporters of the SNF family [Tissierella praeacuta]